jgi:hypothetical protein
MTTTKNNTDLIKDPVKESMLSAEIYKKDKRITSRSNSIRWGKNKPGLRFINSIDFKDMTETEIFEQLSESWNPKNGYTFQINKTYQKRTNIMSGEMFYERYDTPHFCSPSSESYWSM